VAMYLRRRTVSAGRACRCVSCGRKGCGSDCFCECRTSPQGCCRCRSRSLDVVDGRCESTATLRKGHCICRWNSADSEHIRWTQCQRRSVACAAITPSVIHNNYHCLVDHHHFVSKGVFIAPLLQQTALNPIYPRRRGSPLTDSTCLSPCNFQQRPLGRLNNE
jgi:hypothetical protein